MTDYPRLSYLLGAYFHQNWRAPLERAGVPTTSESVIHEFGVAEGSAACLQTADEVASLLRQDLPEPELRSLLARMGSSYYPPGDGMSYRQWLVELTNLLAPSPD